MVSIIPDLTETPSDSIPDRPDDRPGPSGPCDRSLVRRCLQGDRHGYQQLYRRYQAQVRSTLYQLCGPSHLDDLVQEVFLRVWKGLPKFRQASQFSTWLYRIVWNVASTERRQLAQAYAQQQTLCQTVGTSPDNSDFNLMHLHYQDLVQRGLAKLSLDHRAVLVLHDLEDVPQKEIAKILSVPVGTVKSRLFHARAAMRKFLQAEGVQL